MKKHILYTLLICTLTSVVFSQEKVEIEDLEVRPPISKNLDVDTLIDLEDEVKESKRVRVGALDWYSYPSDLSEEKAGNPVGIIDIPSKGSRCTAFTITPKIVMTNNHCIRNQTQANGATVVFHYSKKSYKAIRYRCSKFLYTNKALDYTLLECDNSPGENPDIGRITFQSDIDNIDVGDNILVVHQNCDWYSDSRCRPYKKFSKGQIVRKQDSYNKLYYNADTFGGSSGSPVFSRNRKGKYLLVALHNLGYGNNGKGVGLYNSGINGPAIVYDILNFSPLRNK